MSWLAELALNPAIDWVGLRTRFAQEGRVRIRDVLAGDTAARLHATLRGREDWMQVVNSGDKVFELDRMTRAGFNPEQMDALDRAVQTGAQRGFQYRYETLRLSDGDGGGPAGDAALSPITRWFSEDAARAALRRLTGAQDIAFADGQATAYSPGDFLTGHTDEVAGKARRAAYVLGLTPEWRIEWGGLLLFHGHRGDVAGVAPGFNTLDVFSVPQVHSVTRVVPEAPFRRYAITGWLRAAR